MRYATNSFTTVFVPSSSATAARSRGSTPSSRATGRNRYDKPFSSVQSGSSSRYPNHPATPSVAAPAAPSKMFVSAISPRNARIIAATLIASFIPSAAPAAAASNVLW